MGKAERNEARARRAESRVRVERAEVAAGTAAAGTAAAGGEPLTADQYLNRELSWLEFNRRVLHQAVDERTPLLERVNFLSIFCSNLDEFFMKRVGLLKRQIEAGVMARRPDGLTAGQQLEAMRAKLEPMLKQQAEVYADLVERQLPPRGVEIVGYEKLTAEERRQGEIYFRSSVFPVLTPLAVDMGHPFPFLSNLSTSLGVTLRHPKREEKMFARLKIPRVFPQYVKLPASGGARYRLLSLAELIRHHLDELFPGMTVLDVMAFRITRNADVERDAEDGEDLMDLVEEELRLRRFEKVVRLELGPKPDPWMREFLMQELELTEDDIYEMPGLLDYTTLREVAELPVGALRYEPWTPQVPKALADEEADMFGVIRQGDVLVHHPYESFNASIERFVTTAAADPNVLAIKITLYRTGNDSPFIPALIRAAEAGKQVVATVEIKARFDEAQNIYQAQALEKAGVHVVYGIVGLKTHTKTTLVVRREPEGLRCYAHIGTGNYHVQTAKLYTDLSLLTCRPELTEELVELYHFLTGRSLKEEYKKLLVAPLNMAQRFKAMIEREAANRQAGRPARIVAKMNSLEDPAICQELYRASAAGVPIELLVRGFCCLRPGVAGVSENIRVTSVIGRFLEHSRIYYFRNGAEDPLDGQFYIGSADWMYRNLLARVETIVPIERKSLKEKCWVILQTLLHDHRQAWDLMADGRYVQRTPPEGSNDPGTHETLMALARKEAAAFIESLEGPQ